MPSTVRKTDSGGHFSLSHYSFGGKILVISLRTRIITPMTTKIPNIPKPIIRRAGIRFSVVKVMAVSNGRIGINIVFPPFPVSR